MQISRIQPESRSNDLKGEREGSVEDPLLASACHKPADSISISLYESLGLVLSPLSGSRLEHLDAA